VEGEPPRDAFNCRGARAALAWRAGAAIVVAAAGGDKPEEKLNGVLKRTAQLQLAFGALLAVALVL